MSRQTLHAEFGTKDALGQALILRETESFLAGVTDTLDRQADDLPAAFRAAVAFTLRATAENPLLQTILTSARSGGDETLLPLLTSRSEPLLHRSSDVLCAWVSQHHPELRSELVAEVVDSVVRLVVSHAVVPAHATDVVAERIARLAERALIERD